MNRALRGLYAITDGRQGVALISAVAAALRGGVAMVQYRDKTTDHARRYREARQLLTLCRAHRVPLIINDDVALCGEVAADGVHLGGDDLSPAVARASLGDDAIIGLSCYDTQPVLAHAADADYWAFGAVYPSATKPHARRSSLAWLSTMRQQFPERSLAAIGGIDSGRIREVAQTGIDLIAMVQGIFAADDIEQATRTMAAELSTPSFP